MKPSITKMKAIDAVIDFAKASSTEKDIDSNFIKYFNYAYIVHSMLDDETFHKWISILNKSGIYKGFKISEVKTYEQTPVAPLMTDGKKRSNWILCLKNVMTGF